MDTTYVSIMLVVFLVITGLAIDIGYMYVSEEDLQGTAETAALTGAEAIKQRILYQVQHDPKKIQQARTDLVQTAARNAAVEVVSGKHTAVALMDLANNNGNALTEDNDITVGFWDVTSRTYQPGGTPVNAIQVRTKRTAESASVGLGSLGSFLARITGTDSFGSTPVAIAAIPLGTRANIAVCSEVAVNDSCTYPDVCSVREEKLTPAGTGGNGSQTGGHYLYTSLLHPPTLTNTMSEMVCQEVPQQQVCSGAIYTSPGTGNAILRDIKAMMYDPKVDSGNKEYDKSGRVLGWWVVVPVTDCSSAKPGETFEPRTVTKYATVRISRICASGRPGCGHEGTVTSSPAVACAAGDEGLYIDRISSVSCSSTSLKEFPSLHAVLVGQ
ncbi:MAG TPA: Tad domain-containing protein [Geomonas sp.]|nr:Tad domain-containing protein [Geomonas sp.]